jgi:hypothetical protein
MNRVYIGYFPNRLPARSAFGTTGLALGHGLKSSAPPWLSDRSRLCRDAVNAFSFPARGKA